MTTNTTDSREPESEPRTTCPDCRHRMDMHRRLDGCMVMVENGARVPRCKCERKPATGSSPSWVGRMGNLDD